MYIAHRNNVFCVVVSATTEAGKKHIGRGCWLYRPLQPGEVHSEFGYKFMGGEYRTWMVVFFDDHNKQSMSLFAEHNLLPIYDNNNPDNPDRVLRLEDKSR